MNPQFPSVCWSRFELASCCVLAEARGLVKKLSVGILSDIFRELNALLCQGPLGAVRGPLAAWSRSDGDHPLSSLQADVHQHLGPAFGLDKTILRESSSSEPGSLFERVVSKRRDQNTSSGIPHVTLKRCGP